MENFFTNPQIHGHSVRSILLILFVGYFSVELTAQQVLSTSNRKARKLYEKADKKYKERSFYDALNLLEQSVEEDPLFFEAHIRMGSLYNAIGQEDSVYSKFQAYLATTPNPIVSIVERLAFMAFDRGEYEKSQTFLNRFLANVPQRAGDRDIDLLAVSLSYAQDQILSYQDTIVIEELPENINQYRLQYLPSITIDNAAMFYTKRDHVQGDEDIVVSHYENDSWQPAQSVSARINSPLNEGACTVSADGRVMIFTSCDKRDSFGSCDLYITKKIGNIWSKPKNLGRPINSKYWESQPSLSADGKTLYFASNRLGGYGGRDLWISKNIDGRWTTPSNLGETINSPKDETTPFIHPNGETLYYSANGFKGMGGYDLYKAELNDTIWSLPENLGFPINTHKDEVAIIIASDGETAFFAKEEQKNFEILDSKIVKTTLQRENQSKPTTYLIGVVLDADSKKPLEADVQIVDLIENQNIYRSESDAITGLFYMVLPVNLSLAAYVKKKGYLFSVYKFETNENFEVKGDTLTIYLQKVAEGESIVLKNIYFDFDSYELEPESKSEIENVY
ncbi:MAG: hypothetical protein AAFY41_01055, partial [Bacteroidota bacterium]